MLMYLHHYNLMALMNFDSYESAADYFAPENTNLLFLAEAPPSSVERYFYYPRVQEHDWLWIGLMRAIYGEQFGDVYIERSHKMDWLKKFQSDGFKLIDVMKRPFYFDEQPNMRKELIKNRLDYIVDEIREINPNQILIIKVTVYDALYQDLKNRGLPVVNARLPFPSSGQQIEFQDEFEFLVDSGKIFLT